MGSLRSTTLGKSEKHISKHYLPKRFLQPSTFIPISSHFSDEEKKDKWVTVVAPAGAESVGVVEKREAGGPAPVHSPVTLAASLISPSTALSHVLPPSKTSSLRKAYIHVVQTSGYNPGEAGGAEITVSGGDDSVLLREGDGLYVLGDSGQTLTVQNTGNVTAEVLLFDVE